MLQNTYSAWIESRSCKFPFCLICSIIFTSNSGISQTYCAGNYYYDPIYSASVPVHKSRYNAVDWQCWVGLTVFEKPHDLVLPKGMKVIALVTDIFGYETDSIFSYAYFRPIKKLEIGDTFDITYLTAYIVHFDSCAVKFQMIIEGTPLNENETYQCGFRKKDITYFNCFNYGFSVGINDTCTTCANVGLADNEMSHSAIFPNPAVDIVSINLNPLDVYDFDIVNSCGKVINSGIICGKTELDISCLHSGMYFFILRNREEEQLLLHKLQKL